MPTHWPAAKMVQLLGATTTANNSEGKSSDKNDNGEEINNQ